MHPTIRFAINRISAPRLPLADFTAMCRRLGVDAIEIRNDLAGIEMEDGTPAAAVGAAAREQGLAIRSINALQRFERYDDTRDTEARALARYAADAGVESLVLCPTNSRSDTRTPAERHADLVHALRRLRPLLADHGLTGLVEPLGFEECALRRKSQAVRAFEEIGADGRFRLVHDTFHHHLAGEDLYFPAWTGLVHLSGVEDEALDPAQMRDGHRVLVGAADRLGNAPQLRRLLDDGYAGHASFEPFAAEIASAKDIETRLADSMAFLQAAVARGAVAA